VYPSVKPSFTRLINFNLLCLLQLQQKTFKHQGQQKRYHEKPSKSSYFYGFFESLPVKFKRGVSERSQDPMNTTLLILNYLHQLKIPFHYEGCPNKTLSMEMCHGSRICGMPGNFVDTLVKTWQSRNYIELHDIEIHEQF
jgi:hypothetical protein